MNYQEAIEHAKEVAKEKYIEGMLCHANPNDEELDKCIKCAEEHEQLAEWLEELQKYKQLGTLEEIRKAVELQNPKPPNWHVNPIMENDKLPVCPTCNTIMVRTEILGRTIDEHCVTCGQAIDWGGND